MMEQYILGATGLKVSGLCFGALPMGPLQADLTVEAGGVLILEGLTQGINFIDTAEIYQTYPHIRWALERFTGNLVIATKSMAAGYSEMKESVIRCLNALGRDQIEIVHLHAARDSNPLTNRSGALEALLEFKSQKVIQAIGVACHSVTGIGQAASDPRIDIVFPLINRTGLGILDGTVADMAAAIDIARRNNKGIYAMKALGGGTLLEDVIQNINFVRRELGIPVVAVGMLRQSELDMNLAIFEDRPVTADTLAQTRQYRKKAKVTFLCKGCGRCIDLCHNNAITLTENHAVIDGNKCLLCGYCSRECPQFAIRVI
jgi:predicted aldo/keto reductase-like oxidoreductase